MSRSSPSELPLHCKLALPAARIGERHSRWALRREADA